MLSLTKKPLAGRLFVLSLLFFSPSPLSSKQQIPSSQIILPSDHCKKLLAAATPQSVAPSWSFSSGNQAKITEIKSLFDQLGARLDQVIDQDLREIHAPDVAIVIHKASQLEPGVMIEDSSLDVINATIGPNIKWYMDKIDRYIGRKAVLHSLIGYRLDDQTVLVIKKSVSGFLVTPRGSLVSGAKLSRYFQPKGSSMTLAELADSAWVDSPFNPRALAIRALLDGEVSFCSKPMDDWHGDWQNP